MKFGRAEFKAFQDVREMTPSLNLCTRHRLPDAGERRPGRSKSGFKRGGEAEAEPVSWPSVSWPSRWPSRWGPPRQGVEGLLDVVLVGNEGDNATRTAASWAGLCVDLKDACEELGPRSAGGLLGGLGFRGSEKDRAGPKARSQQSREPHPFGPWRDPPAPRSNTACDVSHSWGGGGTRAQSRDNRA